MSISVIGIGQTTGSILGIVTDEQGATIPGATVTVKNTDTNTVRTGVTGENGRYRVTNLPVGNYEVSVQANGFTKYLQTGIVLVLNQDAAINIAMKTGGVVEVVTVTENASQLNTVNAEVGVRFDSKRISDLPLAANGNIYAIALSAAGVSQLGSGQQAFAGGMSYSSNGGRLRSNNFTIDGQDINDPSVTGAQQSINNPDIVQEVRLITNQFSAEYGRNSGSIFSVITKSGTNNYHGTLSWFHNDNALNTRTNIEIKDQLNKSIKKSPYRIENRFGGTFGGPVKFPGYNGKDKTFFFGSLLRFTDRQTNFGSAISGAPTAAGRAKLQAFASRPQVAAVLKYVPVSTQPNGNIATFRDAGVDYEVELGDLVSSAPLKFDDWQWNGRIDHQLSSKHQLGGRYIYDSSLTSGTGQTTPPGATSVVPSRSQAASTWVTSIISSRWVNDARISWSRFGSRSNPFDITSQDIPSVEVTGFGLTGFNAAANRTGIGLAVNLPQFRFNNTYQIQDTVSYTAGSHSVKFGGDIRRTQVKSYFQPTVRGRLVYEDDAPPANSKRFSIAKFMSGTASSATINVPIKGGSENQYYNNYDYYMFGQDEWKVTRNFTLTFGLRYELPGNTLDDLVAPNDTIVVAAGGNEKYRFTPVPPTDTNNFQPRLGFSWNPRFESGFLGKITGGDKLVVRGGAVRTYDASFININLNVASAFPFVTVYTASASERANAYKYISDIRNGVLPAINPDTQTRTIVASDFRTPVYDQFSLDIQRELYSDLIFKVGYVGTRGTGLFQTIDGNPTQPPSGTRVDPTKGIIRLRANAASSIYHSLQTSIDKRLSRNFSAGIHYTYSMAIDTASEIFNPSSGEVAVAQDSFNRRADRARSSYDRPHRFAGNLVYEIPYLRDQRGVVGKFLGGWQINSLFTLQDGAPFTVLNGSDPAGALSGISGLVGNAIRPNLNTNLDLSSMTLSEILAAGGGNLFSPTSISQRVGNLGRNTLRADGINNIDFGIQKNTRLAEGKSLQFRADMFNATNTPNYGIPEGRMSNINFLKEALTNAGNRRIVLGLKLIF